MIRTLSSATIAALLCLCSPAHAGQTQPAEGDEGQDCILIGVRWDASAAETTAILDEPVPASYLANLNNREPCAFAPPPADLVQWHLQFGNEQSTIAALRFVEDRQYRASPDGDIHLARIAVTAADFWHSERLLELARPYVRATERWLTLARELEEGAVVAPGSMMQSQNVERLAPDVILRSALIKAEISGDRRDYESAMALVQQLTPADFVTAAGVAYGSGDDFCDWGRGRLNAEQLAPFSERCEEFETAGMNPWDVHTRMHLSPFTPTPTPNSPFSFATDRAASFLTRQRRNDDIAPGSRQYYDEIYRLVALYINQADASFRQDRTPQYVGNAVNHAQYHLLKAIPWISAADHPNLFRRVAARYLELDALGRSERSDHVRPNHQEQRFVIWLRKEVALLNRLYGQRDFAPAYRP